MSLAVTMSLGTACMSAQALEIATTVLDRGGEPVPHAVIYALPESPDGGAAETPPRDYAVMGQQNQAFVPHILVVEAGTRIAFPNTDDISHHVYSFSPAKSFELPLYKGNAYAPLTFNVPGVVTLGCNIHDGMLGYILVVDTPYFALTDAQGLARLDKLPADAYAVHVWTPRLRAEHLPEPRHIALSSEPANLEFRFKGKLFPPHTDEGTSLSWQDY